MTNDQVEFLANLIKTSHDELSEQIGIMSEDLETLKVDVSGLKSDITGLKTDVASLNTDVAELKIDITEIKDHLKSHDQNFRVIREELRNISGLPQEIDHVLGRVIVIEKHLGITPAYAHADDE